MGLAHEEQERKRPIGLLLFGELASCAARGGPILAGLSACDDGPGRWALQKVLGFFMGLQEDQNWTQIGPKLGPIKKLIIIKNTNNKNKTKDKTKIRKENIIKIRTHVITN